MHLPRFKTLWLVVAAIVVIAIAAFFVWSKYFRAISPQVQAPAPPAAQAPAAAPAEEAGLGATLYQEVNPAEQLPTTNPFTETPNPLEGVYQNPFGE